MKGVSINLAAFVLDASASLPWCFADEATSASDALLHRLHTTDEAFVPAHWPTEMMNSLLTAVRRKRITMDVACQFAEDIADLPIRVQLPTDPLAWAALLDLAGTHWLTVYDAAYLALALNRGIPLATRDRALHTAAATMGVSLEMA